MNPFPIVKYKGPKYFCDRVNETKVLSEALKSGRSVTLYAIRRLGKTGLIHHVFHQLQRSSKYICIYMDIYDTASNKDFVNSFCNQVLQSLEKSDENYLKRVTDFFGKYRPSISFDSITGSPSISLDIKTQQDFQMSMDVIMDYIKSQKKEVIIAIDEFQQIEFYDNKHLAASLRKYLQTIPNLTMVFAGSQRHMLLDLFASPKQALYRTTQMMPLDKINKAEYHQYISFHFKQGLKKIASTLIDDILDWTRVHTYYTQYFCHRLYAKHLKHIKAKDVDELKYQLLKENEVLFQNYRQLMSAQQWKLLKAIAIEQRVVAPTSKTFIRKHDLGAHSTVRLSLAYLEEKQMVYHEFDDETQKPIYFVYDVFLSKWIQSLKR